MSTNDFKGESQEQGVDKKRRSLTKAGLTTPVIASLFSRPAFAQQCSGSALASGNLSNPVDLTTCGTCLSSQWLNATSAELASINVSLSDSIESFFAIPSLTSGNKILTGTIEQALSGSITIAGSPFSLSNGTEQDLKNAISTFTTACLNSLHIATRVNFTPTFSDIANGVNGVLTLPTTGNKNVLDMTPVNSLAASYTEAIGDGASCSINRTTF